MEEKLILTTEQAISLLSDDEKIHTFRSAPMAMIGADWDRKDLVKKIKECQCEIGGEDCRSMNHGLVIWTDDDNPLFVETRENAVEEFENN